MLRLATDEHIDRALIRGLLARQPDLDIVRVQQAGLLGADDRDILAWAAAEGRILITHDRNTIPGFVYERIRAGGAMPGVIIVDDQLPLGKAIDELLILAVCSNDEEWRDQIVYVPM
jgi:predicted nuclease of predicted toxin-antitoxin system